MSQKPLDFIHAKAIRDEILSNQLYIIFGKKIISSTQLLHLNTHQNIDMLYLNLQGMWRFHANSSVFYSKRVMSDVMVLSYNGRGS